MPNLLIFLWICTLYWGERKVWKDSVRSCAWDTWEDWPAGAAPHHVALVADPQLVDAHTYPGRGPFLSHLTEYYTDSYLYRGYVSLQSRLRPDTTFFLGDLFDGGREWATADGSYVSPDKRFKSYGEDYWESEYRRFVRLFFNTWKKSTGVSEIDDDEYGTISDTEKRLKAKRQQQRQIVASLPGNHDIGFSNRVNTHVRDRFETWFGPANRLDVIGNHSFVSFDGPSLSAMDPGERNAAGQLDTEPIFKPTKEFLDNVQGLKAKAVRDELRELRGETYYVPDKDTSSEDNTSEFPTVILTHVPFWRDPDTDCGPLRERHLGAGGIPDDWGNSIKIERGYQYQNVLTDWTSRYVLEKVGNGVKAIYSGDDHDYCEIEHTKYAREGETAAREITVKSTSMVMGVRKPGFLLVSLWNPVDTQTGKPIPSVADAHRPTIQNKLCLLPDQVSIYMRYIHMAELTAAVLLIYAVFALCTSSRQSSYTLLTSPRSRGIGRSTSANNLSGLEDVLEDQPLLPVHRQSMQGQRLSPHPSSKSLSTMPLQSSSSRQQSSGKDDRGMKSVSSSMTSNEAMPSGLWSASSSSSAGHGNHKGSMGGRGRSRSITSNSGGKTVKSPSPITIVNGSSMINGSKSDNDNLGKSPEESGLKLTRTSSSPRLSGVSGYPPNSDRETGSGALYSQQDTGSHAIDLESMELETFHSETRDPFGPSLMSSAANPEHTPRISTTKQVLGVLKTHILRPLRRTAIVGVVFYLLLLWTW